MIIRYRVVVSSVSSVVANTAVFCPLTNHLQLRRVHSLKAERLEEVLTELIMTRHAGTRIIYRCYFIYFNNVFF